MTNEIEKVDEPEDSPKSEATQPKLRWYQYSLRSLLIFMLVSGFFFAWLGEKVYKAREQRAAVAWVEEKGGGVFYVYEFDAEGNLNMNAQPPGPEWLREWIGIEYFCDVYEVNYLVVSQSKPDRHLEDVYPLVSLTHLRVLALSNSQVSNLSSLESLTNLETLYLSGTLVTKEEVQKLQLALPNCKIHWDGK